MNGKKIKLLSTEVIGYLGLTSNNNNFQVPDAMIYLGLTSNNNNFQVPEAMIYLGLAW